MTLRIFVTGGAGYVGSHCCKRFAAEGWEVVVYDNLSRGWRDMVRWGPLVEGDILDGAALRAALRAARPDLVAHFAAFAYVGESVERPGMYYRNNLVGSLTLLDAMRAEGVDRLLFSSTCATYGTPKAPLIDESHPQAPINPYGWSKLLVERALADHAAAHGLRYAALRYFNAAGADPDGEIGERHDPEPHVIPLAIRGALADDYVFTINGDDFETRDGSAVRDYVHVADLADAHARAARRLAEGAPSDAFNLGVGVGVTVRELVDAVERATGRTIPRRVGPRRPGDPAALVADAGKARRALGWTPVRSGIDEIVETASRWHRLRG
jgi:UDP-arabinose 4-epimerase